jgi:hypothetical protein
MKLGKIFAPLALCAAVLGLAGCGESPQDIAAKPAVVQQMVENSLSVCQPGPVHPDSAAYAERLGHMLSGAQYQSLKTLQDHHVTVCLDQRLQDQSSDFWHLRAKGFFYPAKDGSGVMTYLDNGMQPSESGFWSGNPAYFRGHTSIDRLAAELNNGKISSTTPSDVTLRGKTSYPWWRTAYTDDGSVLQRTPQLQQPPLKAPPAKPGA